ncbi:hypothetical protein [Paenibacillus sp. IHBB 10380]|uniref:hypothetical protein n=1 Tax=Paenibacillus sp. IHBB 10380 TaxID=1566358 RepID=UPI0005CFC569|nr:hypothetical protein [Paenibacillus sp. IHBB 10380]AJS59984.1 hypothetical protein UB51_17620 [Paenibacillus sp. IHBB 10380]
MFKIFRKKIKGFPKCSNKVDSNEEKKEQELENFSVIPFEKKIVYMKENRIIDFPEKYEHVDGKLTVFEKDKYFSSARRVYDSANIGEYIKRIEIKGNLDGLGECQSYVENDKLQIIVRIASKEMGIIGHSGYVHKYTEEKCRKFTETLAHELVHAKNHVNFIRKFGIEEYKAIRESKNKLLSIAWNILDEYSACRETAEQYNSFDSVERIGESEKFMYTSIMKGVLKNKEKEKVLMDSNTYMYIHHLNYTIATRSAFADVSGNEEEHLNHIGGNDKFSNYVKSIRSLLGEYYHLQPLNEVSYKKLGKSIMCSFLEIYEVEKEEMNDIIVN